MNLENGQYQIGGVPVLDICNEFGTPLYIYDANKMKAQYERLTKAFPKNRLKVLYACKALTNINVLRYFKQLGAGLDTVSIQEVHTGLRAGFAPNDIIFTPNCVSFEEIQMAVKAGVRINIDNISILEQFGETYGNTVPICVRLNPHILAGGNPKISTGHIDSKFGISIYQMRHLERVIAAGNLNVIGLHMHTGSDILDIDVFVRGADILLEMAAKFPNLEYVDFGSGFKVPYKPGDTGTNIKELGEKLGDRFAAFCEEYGRDLELMFEPGKFLVSESGYFCVRTNVIKTTTATVFAGVDSGMNHLIRPMFYDAYHHILNASHPDGKLRYYTVVGYICETDTFAWDRKINEIREGDILVFHNAGAYSFSMASNYNSRFRPAEVLVKDGQAHLIRRRETLDDLFHAQIELPMATGVE
ncbi:MAG: diaminopimelate decarboxylase [Bacteroidota bacterium]